MCLRVTDLVQLQHMVQSFLFHLHHRIGLTCPFLCFCGPTSPAVTAARLATTARSPLVGELAGGAQIVRLGWRLLVVASIAETAGTAPPGW
jgi:hypothetical protein